MPLSSRQRSGDTFGGIIIDYGHGGMIEGVFQTPGAKQYRFTDRDGLWIGEGVNNRQIAARLIELALEHGVRVWDAVAGRKWTTAPHWTELEQADVSLRRRVQYTNSVPGAVLLSIHSNAVGDAIEGESIPVRGLRLFTSKGETRSDRIAKTLNEGLAQHQALRVRGEPTEADFYVLTKTRNSAVLAELGFFTNYNDARYLMSDEGQQAIAVGLLAGLLPWV